MLYGRKPRQIPTVATVTRLEVVALTDSPDRLREYANDAGHARYLAEHSIPALGRQMKEALLTLVES
mgnify:CR=1 FL=1